MLNAIAIIDDRYNGMTNAAIAEKYGCSVAQVERLNQKHGVRVRGKQRRRSHPLADLPLEQLIREAISEDRQLIIEHGLGDGYIAYIDDEAGREDRTVEAAVRSALALTAPKDDSNGK